MNITLLILGVFLILLSTILITINSSNLKDEDLKFQIKEQPIDNLNNKYQKESSVKQKPNLMEQEDDEITSIKHVTNAEDEILFRDIKNNQPSEIIETNQNPTNITERIISLHQEGLSASQIAARLEKGIREIEIILKVNKL